MLSQIAVRHPLCCCVANQLSLQVLETSGGETSGCLLTAMDACATPAGRRRLKDWLCRPLGSPEAIIARQDAVHELMTTASELAAEARASFAGGSAENPLLLRQFCF